MVLEQLCSELGEASRLGELNQESVTQCSAFWVTVPPPFSDVKGKVVRVLGKEDLPESVINCDTAKLGDIVNESAGPFSRGGWFALKSPSFEKTRQDALLIMEKYKVEATRLG